MGIGDIFKANENKQLKEENERLKQMLSPTQSQIFDLENQLKQVQANYQSVCSQLNNANNELQKINTLIQQKQNRLIVLDEEALYQEFGLYRPTYNFASSEQYKQRLESIRSQQKMMLKNKTAVTGNMNWTVNGSVQQGKKMVSDMQKLLLRAFNGECDELVSKVKYNNFESYKKRMSSSCDAISKLGTMMNISISNAYFRLKLDELTLAFEYAQKVQQEKEEQKSIRERMKEEAKLQKEIDEARKKLEKEQNHYENALHKVEQQLQTATGTQREALEIKRQEIQSQLQDNEKAMKDVDYRQANQRAGYVYIISNIGSFGEDVYKIGMTRRLDPQERIDELGSASVPFKFDVHALIFSDDAPKLENALHHAFEDKRVNWVNNRKEFFRVSLSEIKQVVYRNFDKTVAFVDIPEAEQFRVSERLRFEKLGTNTPNIKIPIVDVNSIVDTAPQKNQSNQDIPIKPINSSAFPKKYDTLVSILKKSLGSDINIERSEKNSAEVLMVFDKSNLKLIRIRAYERETNKFDIAMYRPDGTTAKMLFFNSQDELEGIIKSFREEICV